MTIPKREGEFENGLPRRPAGPGEPEERTDTGAVKRAEKIWRSRFPGWETYEGQPHDPRFAHGEYPRHDPRYNTRLNPSMVVPRRLGPMVWILGVTIGILFLVLVGWLFFYHFQRPAPRSPEAPRGELHTITTQVAMGHISASNR